MVGLLIQLVLLGVGAVAVAALVVSSARRPLLIVYAILAIHGWDLLSGVALSIQVAGIGVGPSELIHLVAFGAALVRIRRRFNAWHGALLAALSLVMLGALRGYIMLGDAALLGFRAELYFLVPALLVSTLPSSMLGRVIAAIVRFGMFLSVVAAGRWVAVGLGMPWAESFTNTGYAVERVINSGATLAVAFSVVALIHRFATVDLRLRRRVRVGGWIIGMVGVAIMAQHRSVWVSALAMAGLLFLRLPRRWYAKVGVSAAIVVAVIVIEVSALGDAGPLADSLTQAATSAGTWEWRVARWDAVWATHAARGWEAIIFGSGYGYSWVSGQVGVWEVSPHNGFLQVAVRLGLVGAALVFLAYGHVLRALYGPSDDSGAVLWLWVVGTLVYFLPYSGGPLTGIVLGAGLVSARSSFRFASFRLGNARPTKHVSVLRSDGG